MDWFPKKQKQPAAPAASAPAELASLEARRAQLVAKRTDIASALAAASAARRDQLVEGIEVDTDTEASSKAAALAVEDGNLAAAIAVIDERIREAAEKVAHEQDRIACIAQAKNIRAAVAEFEAAAEAFLPLQARYAAALAGMIELSPEAGNMASLPFGADSIATVRAMLTSGLESRAWRLEEGHESLRPAVPYSPPLPEYKPTSAKSSNAWLKSI